MLEDYHSQVHDLILSYLSDFEIKLISFWIAGDEDIYFSKKELPTIYGSSLFIYLHFLPQLRKEGLVDHIYLAAKYNNIEIANYIYRKHEQWYRADEKSYVVAGENGNLGFLRWLVKNQCPFNQSSSAITQTLLAGKVECLDYLLGLPEAKIDGFKINHYIGSSTLECARLLVDKHQFQFSPTGVKMAIESRNYPLFKYLFLQLNDRLQKSSLEKLMNTSLEYGCGFALEYLTRFNLNRLCIPIEKIERVAHKYQYFDILEFLDKYKQSKR